MKDQSTEQELLKEIEDSISNIESFMTDIIKNNSTARINPLSVELRKLLSPYTRGDYVLKRAEEKFGIKFLFPDGSKTLPRTRIDVGLEDYINRMIFSIGGRPITRIILIKLVADEKGAHTDEEKDPLHAQSQDVILPLGNPARDRLFFEQNHLYLVEIAKTIVQVVKNQLLEK
ncbi:hypothetical protein HY468_00500 [Candidatus Roizmanbacteria bacterium]|nr:hypothetical protein [Candidatus Roizmanbacteria bacterium]